MSIGIYFEVLEKAGCITIIFLFQSDELSIGKFLGMYQ